MPATAAWLASAEALLNRGIASSTSATVLARRLKGTTLLIEVLGVTRVRAALIGDRLALTLGDDHAADAVISGSVPALLRLIRGGAHPDATKTAAQIRGDAQTADLYRQLFAAARPDPEEELARRLGDIPARGISEFARQGFAWFKHARRTAGENIAEYLQEESRDLVNQTELDEFVRGVDQLREAADRIEARLGHLERPLQGLS